MVALGWNSMEEERDFLGLLLSVFGVKKKKFRGLSFGPKRLIFA